MKRLAPAFFVALWPTLASSDCARDAMIVFDGSGSMAEMGFNVLDEPRIFEARRAVRQAVPPIAKARRLGLVVYGQGGENNCDVTLEFPPMPDAGPKIVTAIDALQPSGNTALTEAVALAIETLGNRGDVVLVTDGKETCGGATCQLAAELSASAPEITVHVIGFKVRGEHFTWNGDQSGYGKVDAVAKCLADQTLGQYVTAETLDQLIAAFWRTLGCAPVA